MTSRSIATIYRAHQDAIPLRTGEGAEILEICNLLAATLKERLGELPLPPLGTVLAYPVARVAVYPTLVIVAGDTDWDESEGNSCRERATHRIDVVLLCGPAAGDPAMMRGIGLPYQWPIRRVLRANADLEGAVENIFVPTAHWGRLPYGGTDHYGLNFPIEVTTGSHLVPAWMLG